MAILRRLVVLVALGTQTLRSLLVAVVVVEGLVAVLAALEDKAAAAPRGTL